MKRPRLASFMILALAVLALSFLPASQAPDGRSAAPPELDSCTSILVGRLASVDGSTMTSHSCDSGTDRTWMTIVPNAKHKPGEKAKVYYEPKRTKGPNDPDRLETGEIPQVAETYAFLNAAYPIMNEHQLAIGETTIGSRRELVSEAGIIDAPELYRLVLERAKTAREAIRVADELTKTYGYNDWGECFTFADTKEVWHFEIHGPGKGKIGAVWAAQRVPDDEIGVSANAGRIRQIDLANADLFMASANVTSLAEEMGFWSKASGRPFEFSLRLRSRFADEPLLPPPRVAGPEPARPVAQAQSRIRELPVLGQAREEGRRRRRPGHLPRHLRRDGVRHDPDPDGGQPERGDRQEPGRDAVHDRRYARPVPPEAGADDLLARRDLPPDHAVAGVAAWADRRGRLARLR